MKNRKKFLTTLALVLFGTVGAWAQEPEQPQQVQESTTQWTLDMPANNLLLNVQYNYPRTLSNVPEGWTVKADGETVTANADSTYTIFDGAAVQLIPPTDEWHLVKDVEIEEEVEEVFPAAETPLTFEAKDGSATVTLTWNNSSGTLTCPLDAKVQFSTDEGDNWSDYTIGTGIELSAGEKVQFLVTENVAALHISNPEDGEDVGSCIFSLTGNCYAYGNVMSLLYTESAFATATSFQSGSSSNFVSLFANCESLYSHPTKDLVLPATALTTTCYTGMFSGCINLTKAPVLPAQTLTFMCYQNMFGGCTNLNYIKCLATNISAGLCLDQWVDGVQTTPGTFEKDASVTFWVAGTNVPAGWTIEDAD